MGRWERFEFRPCPDTPPEAGHLYNLWYSFTASFIKWEYEANRFNITNKRERAVQFAMWRPSLIQRSEGANPYQLGTRVQKGIHSLSPENSEERFIRSEEAKEVNSSGL